MYKIYKRILLLITFSLLCSLHTFGIGADESYPILEKMFSEMPIPENTIYTVTDQDMAVMLDKSVELYINLFELIDCIYRYLAPNNKRFEISGDVLRNAQTTFSYGDPIETLLPIENIEKLQVGACFTQEQKPLDMWLSAPYSVFIKVATAVYDTRCGFGKMKPLNFLEPYGMQVKKWNIIKNIRKFQLFEPGRSAVYAEGFFRPKTWWVDPVSRLQSEP
jgi:hypothetical protein